MPKALLVGLVWAVTILTRPTALVGFLILVFILVFQKKWKELFILWFFPILLVGGWSVRNSLLYHRPLFTTTAGALALWVGNNTDASGGYDKSFEILRAREQHHSTQLSSIALTRTAQFIRAEPLTFLHLQIKKTVIYFSLLRPTGFWFHLWNRPVQQLITLALSATTTAFLFIVGVSGLFLYVRAFKNTSAFLLVTTILQPLVVIPLYVETRYRFPLFLFLAIFSAYASVLYWYAVTEKRSHIRKVLGIVLVLFLLISAADVVYSFDLIYERSHELLQKLL